MTVQPARRGDDEEAVDGLFPDTAALSELERQINSNTAFHGFKNVNTTLSACRICKRILLQFAVPVHCHEIHTHHVEEEMER